MSLSRCIYREEHGDVRIEIWQQARRRSLWFDDVILQTEIHLDDPGRLPNPVNQAMLAPLMFALPLERVLLAGCGGGAIARWLHHRRPDVHGDAVEVSATIARLAREYFDFPPQGSRWRLLVGDIREHLALGHNAYDFILVDLEERQHTPAWVLDEPFLQACRAHLTASGALTLNLIVDHGKPPRAAIPALRRHFPGDLLLLQDPGHDNLLVTAFASGAPSPPSAAQVAREARRWGIDLGGFATRMTRVA